MFSLQKHIFLSFLIYNIIDNTLNNRINVIIFKKSDKLKKIPLFEDCVRICGDFIISKACENAITLWKFGDFESDTGVAGKGTPSKFCFFFYFYWVSPTSSRPTAHFIESPTHLIAGQIKFLNSKYKKQYITQLHWR